MVDGQPRQALAAAAAPGTPEGRVGSRRRGATGRPCSSSGCTRSILACHSQISRAGTEKVSTRGSCSTHQKPIFQRGAQGQAPPTHQTRATHSGPRCEAQKARQRVKGGQWNLDAHPSQKLPAQRQASRSTFPGPMAGHWPTVSSRAGGSAPLVACGGPSAGDRDRGRGAGQSAARLPSLNSVL